MKGFDKQDFLMADGKDIRNRKGETVLLQGTNLGGWLHREGWMDGGGMDFEESSPERWVLLEAVPACDLQDALNHITDGRDDTRWSTETAQKPHASRLVLDLGEEITVNTVELNGGDSAGDYPAGISLSLSQDLTGWGEPVHYQGKASKIQKITFPPVKARYIQLEQTGERADAYWSISGIRVYREIACDDFTSRRILRQRFGEAEAEALLESYQQSYLTGGDLGFLKKLGFNFLRLPIYWQELLDPSGRWKPGAFDQIDWLVEECGKRRIYVMLDLHGSPGGHSGGWLTGGQTGSNELWTNPVFQEWDKEIWRIMARRYRDNPAVAAYDLLNEPVPPEGSPITAADFYDMLYRTVREEDGDHIVCMEAFFNFDALGDPKDHGWENVIYQTHHYGENQENIMDYAMGTAAYLREYRDRFSIPVLAGEFNFWKYMDVWRAWYSELTRAGISWSNWTYKNTEKNRENCWGFYDACDSAPIDFARDSLNEIRIKMAAYSTPHYQCNERLCRIAAVFTGASPVLPIPRDALDGRCFTASASHHSSQADHVLDGNPLTLWSPHTRLATGQWLCVDMKELRTVWGVVMDAGAQETSFPRRFQIQLSRDGSLWECAAACRYDDSTAERWTISFPAQNARYLRIFHTGSYRIIEGGVPYSEDTRWCLTGLFILGDGENRPPELRAIKQQVLTAGQPFTCKLSAEAGGEEPLIYFLENPPAGASLEPQSGVFRWLPDEEDSGRHYLTFGVTDGRNRDTQIMACVVRGKPELLPVEKQVIPAGKWWRWQFPSRNAAHFTCENLPAGCCLHPRTGVLTWTPMQPGRYTLDIRGDASISLEIEVTDTKGPVAQAFYTSQDAAYALTKGDDIPLVSGREAPGGEIITVRKTRRQPFEGFGSSLDGSTVYNIVHQPPESRAALMEALFHPVKGAGFSSLRICFGASDFAADSFYTYDDMPPGETDPELLHFSIRKDEERRIPDCIREALEINPDIKIIASVWSPPAWMKENESLINGGRVRPEYYGILAGYYVKCVQAYERAGIPIYAVTLQNEPDVVQPYPTASYTAEEQAAFLACLHRAFREAGLTAKIWIMDTNFSSAWEYAWKVLQSPGARSQADGVAFHDYSGEPDAMLGLLKDFPEKTMHITERSTYNIEGAARVISYFRCGARSYLAWLIFLDDMGEPAAGPLDGSNPPQPIRAPHGDIAAWHPTVDYFYYSQISRFVQPGAVVLDSDPGRDGTIANVAFLNPDGTAALYVVNRTDEEQPFTVRTGEKQFSDNLPPQTAATYLFPPCF